MGFIYVFFGLFAIMFVGVIVFIIVMFTTKINQNNKNSKGDYISPKPKEKKSYNTNSADDSVGSRSAQRPVEKPIIKPVVKTSEKNDGVSPVHANCDHAKQPSPYIDINDTYSMVWDEFKSFTLKLLSAEYPSAKISPYRYRGAPDIQLVTGGKNVDVRLIFVRDDVTVDKNDFDAALKDVDEKDDVADWIITNGRFSVMQRSAANAKRVTLCDADDIFAMMRRCNISAKKA